MMRPGTMFAAMLSLLAGRSRAKGASPVVQIGPQDRRPKSYVIHDNLPRGSMSFPHISCWDCADK
jgi:hypothetical protein